MSRELLRKTAAVLDALAEEDAMRPAPAPDPLLVGIEARRGEPLPPETAAKVASDPILRDLLAPMLAAPETRTALGGPSEKRAATDDARTDAERLDDANRRFVELVMTRPNED